MMTERINMLHNTPEYKIGYDLYMENKYDYLTIEKYITSQSGGASVKGKSKRKSGNKHRSKSEKNSHISSKGVVDIDTGDKIVELLKRGSREDILDNLFTLLTFSDTCDTIMGDGFVGIAKVSAIGPTFTVRYKDKEVSYPVVVKEAHVESEMNVTVIDDKLYILCSRGLTIEAIILYFIRDLIRQNLSPNLPLILAHGTCVNKMIVDKLVTQRHGLPEYVSVPISGVYESPLWQNIPGYDPINPVYSSKIATLDELSTYMYLKWMINKNDSDNDDTVELPNGISCDMIELYNYITISFIITADLLKKHNIYLLDMHPQNIFIHWLNDNSYLNDKFVGNTKYIFYKRGDKYYKIKTFGMFMKIGDVGACIVTPQDDTIVVGQANDIHKTHHIIDKIIKYPKYFDLPLMFSHIMSYDTLRKTIAYKIITTHPYDKKFWFSQPQTILDDMPTPDDILKYFDRYTVDKIDEKDSYLVF